MIKSKIVARWGAGLVKERGDFPVINKIKKCYLLLMKIGYSQHQIDEITRFCVGAKALFNLKEEECIFLLANLEKHIELATKFFNC